MECCPLYLFYNSKSCLRQNIHYPKVHEALLFTLFSLTRLVLYPLNNKTSWTLRKYIFTETNPVIVMQHLTSHPWSWCPALAGSTPVGLILPSWAYGTSWAWQARRQGPSFVGPLEYSGPWCRHSPTASPQAALRNFIISRCASFFLI